MEAPSWQEIVEGASLEGLSRNELLDLRLRIEGIRNALDEQVASAAKDRHRGYADHPHCDWFNKSNENVRMMGIALKKIQNEIWAVKVPKKLGTDNDRQLRLDVTARSIFATLFTDSYRAEPRFLFTADWRELASSAYIAAEALEKERKKRYED